MSSRTNCLPFAAPALPARVWGPTLTDRIVDEVPTLSPDGGAERIAKALGWPVPYSVASARWDGRPCYLACCSQGRRFYFALLSPIVATLKGGKA